jgi:hypothetical protein
LYSIARAFSKLLAPRRIFVGPCFILNLTLISSIFFNLIEPIEGATKIILPRPALPPVAVKPAFSMTISLCLSIFEKVNGLSGSSIFARVFLGFYSTSSIFIFSSLYWFTIIFLIPS